MQQQILLLFQWVAWCCRLAWPSALAPAIHATNEQLQALANRSDHVIILSNPLLCWWHQEAVLLTQHALLQVASHAASAAPLRPHSQSRRMPTAAEV